MLVGIHQPHYMPWLRYIQKIAASDLFILLDDVDYTKNGWQNRNKIKDSNGWMYLTVPVKASMGQHINEVEIAGTDWAQKHLKAIVQNYSKAPYFKNYIAGLEAIYSQNWTSLAQLNKAMLGFYLAELGIRTPVVESSTLGVETSSTDRLICLVKAVGGTGYYTGQYAVDAYLDVDAFTSAGISLKFQEWHCPEYPQLYPRAGFVPDMAIIDLLFNVGPGSLEVLIRGGQPEHNQPS